MALTQEYQYDPKLDPRQSDKFGPLTQNCLQMNQAVNVHFIGCEADIVKLNVLKGAPLIGMDSEWRPTVKPFAE